MEMIDSFPQDLELEKYATDTFTNHGEAEVLMSSYSEMGINKKRYKIQIKRDFVI